MAIGADGMRPSSEDINAAILMALDHYGPRTFDELAADLPTYTWNQIFAAVDRLSRIAAVRIEHPGRFEYRIATRTPMQSARGPHRRVV